MNKERIEQIRIMLEGYAKEKITLANINVVEVSMLMNKEIAIADLGRLIQATTLYKEYLKGDSAVSKAERALIINGSGWDVVLGASKELEDQKVETVDDLEKMLDNQRFVINSSIYINVWFYTSVLKNIQVMEIISKFEYKDLPGFIDFFERDASKKEKYHALMAKFEIKGVDERVLRVISSLKEVIKTIHLLEFKDFIDMVMEILGIRFIYMHKEVMGSDLDLFKMLPADFKRRRSEILLFSKKILEYYIGSSKTISFFEDELRVVVEASRSFGTSQHLINRVCDLVELFEVEQMNLSISGGMNEGSEENFKYLVKLQKVPERQIVLLKKLLEKNKGE